MEQRRQVLELPASGTLLVHAPAVGHDVVRGAVVVGLEQTADAAEASGLEVEDAGTPAQRLDSAKSALLSDSDGDGRPNLLEYALGSNPSIADGAPAVGGMLDSANGRHCTLTFTRPLGLTDVTYAVEVSDDLQTWSRDTSQVSLAQSSPSGANETVTYKTTAPLPASGRRFLRLAVTPLP
jgi:hypothetical protein